MRMNRLSVLVVLVCALALVFAIGSCSGKKSRKAPAAPKAEEIWSFRFDTMNGVLATNGSIDPTQGADSTKLGALKIEAPGPGTTWKLVQTGPLDVDNVNLIYRATFRCRELSGRAYLLMMVRFPDGLETMARGAEQAILGSVPWVTEDISLTIDKGKKPENVTLGLVTEGTGTVWIDNVKLLTTPAKAFPNAR